MMFNSRCSSTGSQPASETDKADGQVANDIEEIQEGDASEPPLKKCKAGSKTVWDMLQRQGRKNLRKLR